jgi:hypothetical protein
LFELSVHDRSIWLADVASADKFEGAAGEGVGEGDGVGVDVGIGVGVAKGDAKANGESDETVPQISRGLAL